ncbi:carbamoyltransferase N-terminal domain-containing protein, partial [Rhodoblastus sp.]|uniref:carbamoyltransferase N-terminal domain-containing protein n=1 Tax=Rhodoblastus sp. TaxID=1962975 RepID=UPI0035B4A927
MTTTGTAPRYAPLRPRLAALGFRAMLPAAERYFRSRNFHRPDSAFAAERARELAARLERGETAYLVGVNIGGFHNTGVALVEVTPSGGPHIICNNEEERFSGEKHSNLYPRHSLAALAEQMAERGISPDRVVAWLATYDLALFFASGFRSMLEEFPASLDLALRDHPPSYDGRQLRAGLRAPQELAALFGLDRPAPIIGMRHHDNHAVFSYQVSPFAAEPSPTMVVVIDGSGDFGSISLYLGENGRVRPIRSNASLFDSLGMFYAVISSSQGGWTALSSEGRYMGATAYGDMNRATNPYYQRLRAIFDFRPGGDLRLNRSLANWPRSMLYKPYTPELIDILGAPIAPEQMWNPDSVLRVEDIRHRPNTQERLDKAAATQLVFEDGLFHVIDALIRETGAEQLVLTGGAALNAVANMRLLERFDEAYYRRALGRTARLRLWVPPVPGDSGVTIGAAYAFAAEAGVGLGPRLEHAFYCGRAARLAELQAAFDGAPDVA